MTARADDWASTRRDLQEKLLEVLRHDPEDGATVRVISDAIELLERLDQIHGVAVGQTGRAGATRHGVRKTYLVRPSEGEKGPWLVEAREGNRQAFLAPWDVYVAAAEALSHFDKPVLYGELMGEVAQVLGGSLPDYFLRVCLRCWLEHGLLDRRSRRYSPATPLKPGTFKRAAIRLWRELEGRGYTPGGGIATGPVPERL